MFVEAIVDEDIDREYLCLSIGDKIYGNVRSYKQSFIKYNELVEAKVCIINQEIDYIKEKEIKVKVKLGSIKKVYCGCGELAWREIDGQCLCFKCKYEEPEDFSYLTQSPWESDW